MSSEDELDDYYEELSEANPIKQRVRIPPRSIFPLLPLPDFKFSNADV